MRGTAARTRCLIVGEELAHALNTVAAHRNFPKVEGGCQTDLPVAPEDVNILKCRHYTLQYDELLSIVYVR